MATRGADMDVFIAKCRALKQLQGVFSAMHSAQLMIQEVQDEKESC